MNDRRQRALRAPSRRASFEEALERLETIVEELEGGSLSLEESIARYEEGMTLSRGLTQKLDEAEKRIERLVERGNAPPITQPMELEDNGSEAPPPPPVSRASRPAPRATSRPAPVDPDELPF